MLRLICGYATQSGRSLKEKQSFYNELKRECDMHSAGDLIGRHIDEFAGVHGGFGVGQKNLAEGY